MSRISTAFAATGMVLLASVAGAQSNGGSVRVTEMICSARVISGTRAADVEIRVDQTSPGRVRVLSFFVDNQWQRSEVVERRRPEGVSGDHVEFRFSYLGPRSQLITRAAGMGHERDVMTFTMDGFTVTDRLECDRFVTTHRLP